MKTTQIIGRIDQARLIAIDHGTLLCVQGPRHGWLRVTTGEVWVTRGGDCDDLLLRAGSRLSIGGRGGATLVSTLPAAPQAVITIEPAPSRFAHRVARALAALRDTVAAGAGAGALQPRS